MRFWTFFFLLVFVNLNVSAKNIGVWVKGQHSAQANLACFTTYRCTPSNAVIYEGTLKVTPAQTVWGVCHTMGTADQCKLCATSEPKIACEWEIIPNQ